MLNGGVWVRDALFRIIQRMNEVCLKDRITLIRTDNILKLNLAMGVGFLGIENHQEK